MLCSRVTRFQAMVFQVQVYECAGAEAPSDRATRVFVGR